MKKSIILIISVLVLSISACTDLLDVKPISELGYGSFWVSEEAAVAGMAGLHADLREIDKEGIRFLLGEVRSDTYGGDGFAASANDDLIYQDIRVDNAPFGGWAGFYTKIQRVNDAIKNIQAIEFTSDNDKNYMIGQAYGLRAYYYYTMLKTWGEVPLVTEPTESVDFSELEKPRASEQEVMAQIKSDLNESLSAFGSLDYFKDNQRVYWSKAASLILKGDVYIWSGTHLGGGATDYQTAKSALEDVVAIPGINLLPNYSDVFDYSNKNNNEIIFAFKYSIDEPVENDGRINFYWQFTALQNSISNFYDSKGNLQGSSLNLVIGGSRYHASDKALNVLFEDSLDQRGDATWIRFYRNPDATDYVGSVTNKFLGTDVNGIRFFIDDVPVYRYADALLLLAEAKNLLGQDPSAEINRIRERAYGANFDINEHGYTNQTQELNTDAILEERFKEFQQEAKRWWDLRRAGDQYVIEHIEFLEPGDEYKLVLPITREMIGRNPALTQTPGYGN